MGDTMTQQLPESFDGIELGAVTRQAVELEVRMAGECGINDGAAMPGGVVDREHHAWVVRGRIGTRDVIQMTSEAMLQTAGLVRAFPAPRARVTGQGLLRSKLFDEEASKVADAHPEGARGRAGSWWPSRRLRVSVQRCDGHQRGDRRRARG